MKQSLLRILGIISDKLSALGIEWFLYGSTNLMCQGIDVTPSSIGIGINHRYFSRVVGVFSDCVGEIINLENGEGQEYKFIINGFRVVICGDYDHGFYWKKGSNPDNIIELHLGKIDVPALTLEAELECYDYLKLNEKADKIRKFLADTR